MAVPVFHVIATASPLYRVDVSAASATLHDLARVSEFQLPREAISGPDADRVISELHTADGLLVRIGTLSRDLIERLPNLKVVALHGVGVDQVDVRAATVHGIWVTNVPGGNTPGVVELTIGLYINLLRCIPTADRELRQGTSWDESRYLGTELGSKTIGLIGYGNIARGVARICQAFGSTVIATRKSSSTAGEDGVEFVPLEEVLRQADIVSIHVPLTDETLGLIDRRAIAKMKPGSYLVNVARGPIVDQSALEEALLSGHLAGAGLDVLGVEPPDTESPIFSMPNTVITPHMAGSTEESLRTIAIRASEDIAKVLSGDRPLNPVNNPIRS